MELNIVYENPGHYFSPGETIRGHVDAINPSKDGIEVLQFISRCMGRAITSWTDNHPPQETVYTETLKYFKRTACPDPPIQLLPPGTTHVGFVFQLPADFKTTPLANFKSKFGNIEFYVEAEVEYVKKRTRLTLIRATSKAVRRFRMKPDEVAPPPAMIGPVVREKEWPVGLFFFGRRGAVRMEFRMPTASFLPGQALCYDMTIKNCTRRKIVSVTLKLKQIVTYKAQASSKVRKEVPLQLMLVDYPACIAPTATQIFSGADIKIPTDLPPSGLGACPIIDVAYVLQVVILVFGFHKSKESIPVTICTIPSTSDGGGKGGGAESVPPLERIGRGRSVLDKMESIDIGGAATKYQPIDSD